MGEGTRTASSDRSGIDRRTLIKRAAAAGAAAWVAPVIVGSVASPAGAITGTPGCFRFRVTPHTPCTTTAAGAIGTTCPVTTTQCTPTDVTTATPLSTWCITSSNCDNGSNAKTFTINAGCSCTFLAASGETNNSTAGAAGCGGTLCVTGVISGGGKTVTFADPGGNQCNWVAWRFIVQCA